MKEDILTNNLMKKLLFDYIMSFVVITDKKITEIESFANDNNKQFLYNSFSFLKKEEQYVVIIYVNFIMSEYKRFGYIYPQANQDILNNKANYVDEFMLKYIIQDDSNEKLLFFLKEFGKDVFEVYTMIIDIWDLKNKAIEKDFESSYTELIIEIKKKFNSQEFIKFEKKCKWLLSENIINSVLTQKQKETSYLKEIEKELNMLKFNNQFYFYNKRTTALSRYSISNDSNNYDGFYKILIQNKIGFNNENKDIKLQQIKCLINKNDTNKAKDTLYNIVNSEDLKKFMSNIKEDTIIFQQSIENDIFKQNLDDILKINSIYSFYNNYNKNKEEIDKEIIKISSKNISLPLKIVEVELFLNKQIYSFLDGKFYADDKEENTFKYEESFKIMLNKLLESSIKLLFKKRN